MISRNCLIHILLAFAIRMLLIIYADYHDAMHEVSYTDIDYKVFTDASRHVLNGNSPYARHTYRYTPLIAFLLTPNILIHDWCGKLMFSIIDIVVGLMIRGIVQNTMREYQCYREKTLYKKRKRNKTPNSVQENILFTPDRCMYFWLYNPLSIAIATRGNCDTIAGFLVLATLFFLQCRRNYFVAGLLHGLAIHVRLYPIAYSLALFMSISRFSFYSTNRNKEISEAEAKRNAADNSNLKRLKNIENQLLVQNLDNTRIALQETSPESRKTIFKKEYLLYLVPSWNQMKLIIGTFTSLSIATAVFYHLYGYQFLYETYIYHLIRKDTRHNFSLYFYIQYLTAGVKNIGIWQKVLTVLPQVVLLIVLSVRYGLNKFTLNFSILTLTFVMISYNTVLTSQYFVWFMSILPLCLWQFRMSFSNVLVGLFLWLVAQAAWLLSAYLLEFHGVNTFLLIWIHSVSFFCANMAILGRLIWYFHPFSDPITSAIGSETDSHKKES